LTTACSETNDERKGFISRLRKAIELRGCMKSRSPSGVNEELGITAILGACLGTLGLLPQREALKPRVSTAVWRKLLAAKIRLPDIPSEMHFAAYVHC
jgi:hypothetical protein